MRLGASEREPGCRCRRADRQSCRRKRPCATPRGVGGAVLCHSVVPGFLRASESLWWAFCRATRRRRAHSGARQTLPPTTTGRDNGGLGGCVRDGRPPACRGGRPSRVREAANRGGRSQATEVVALLSGRRSTGARFPGDRGGRPSRVREAANRGGRPRGCRGGCPPGGDRKFKRAAAKH